MGLWGQKIPIGKTKGVSVFSSTIFCQQHTLRRVQLRN